MTEAQFKRKKVSNDSWYIAAQILVMKLKPKRDELQKAVRAVEQRIGDYLADHRGIGQLAKCELIPDAVRVVKVKKPHKNSGAVAVQFLSLLVRADKPDSPKTAETFCISYEPSKSCSLPSENVKVAVPIEMINDLVAAKEEQTRYQDGSFRSIVHKMQEEIHFAVQKLGTVATVIEHWPDAEPALRAHYQMDVVEDFSDVPRPLSSLCDRYTLALPAPEAVEVADEVVDA